MRRPRQEPQEKNAIFSVWLMRRIGASGSLAGRLDFRKIPLAMMVEPSEGSGEDSRAAPRGASATGWRGEGIAGGCTATATGSTLAGTVSASRDHAPASGAWS